MVYESLKPKLAAVKNSLASSPNYETLKNDVEDILAGIYETSLPSSIEELTFTRLLGNFKDSFFYSIINL